MLLGKRNAGIRPEGSTGVPTGILSVGHFWGYLNLVEVDFEQKPELEDPTGSAGEIRTCDTDASDRPSGYIRPHGALRACHARHLPPGRERKDRDLAQRALLRVEHRQHLVSNTRPSRQGRRHSHGHSQHPRANHPQWTSKSVLTERSSWYPVALARPRLASRGEPSGASVRSAPGMASWPSAQSS